MAPLKSENYWKFASTGAAIYADQSLYERYRLRRDTALTKRVIFNLLAALSREHLAWSEDLAESR